MLVGKTKNMTQIKASNAMGNPSLALSLAWKLFFLFALVVCPTDSFAAAGDTFGTLICNIQRNGLSGYASILTVVAYCIGAFLTLRMMLLLKKHADNPSQVSLATPIAHGFAAAGLTMLPQVASMLTETIFAGGQVQGAKPTCHAEATSQASSGVGLDVMMTNFVKNIHQPVFMLIAFIAFIVGATFIVQGLLRAAKAGADPRAADPKIIISNFIFGAILMAIATTLPDMLETIFGDGNISDMSKATNIIQWSKITGSAANAQVADKAVSASLAFIQIIGGIAFLRGWLLLKKAVEGGQATIPQGLTHIIAGAMCVNMDKMLAVIDDTFGTGLIA